MYSRRLSEKTVKQFSEEFQGTLLNGIIEEVQPSKFTVYFPQQRFIGRIESPELQVVVLSEKVEGGENKNNAKEIRSVLESKVLNREVQIFVRGLSPEGLISGHVKAENFDSRKTLLTFGYAKLSKDALNILDVNEFKDLKAISHEAATKLRDCGGTSVKIPTKLRASNRTLLPRSSKSFRVIVSRSSTWRQTNPPGSTFRTLRLPFQANLLPSKRRSR